MPTDDEPLIRCGTKVRHKTGVEGEAMASPTNGSFPVVINRDVPTMWSVHDVTVVAEKKK